MEKITFVLPSRNNLEFLQLAYASIRNLSYPHHCVLILDDASTDGTSEWIKSLEDKNIIHYHNPGPERIGIVGMFDRGIQMSNTDIIFAFHADMVACKDLDTNILKHLKPGVVVSATRVEPPLHPPGPEKITADFGVEVDQFDFNRWYIESEKLKQYKTTEGIFAPWCMYKSDYLAVGGHDELFAPQSKEDSDLFNRFMLKGYKLIQSWDGLVYHFTSRGSRFNKHAGGGAGKNSEEWLYTTNKNARNFIRKWGHFVKHDPLMKPIIPPKYNIAFVVEHCNAQLLELLEPWCDRLYIKDDMHVLIDDYIYTEQPNTKYDLKKRVFHIGMNDPMGENDIVVEINGNDFNQYTFTLIQQLPEIIQETNDTGVFEISSIKVHIQHIEAHEKDLIVCNTSY